MDVRWYWSLFIVGVLFFVVGCCEQPTQTAPSGKDGWLTGSTQEKLDTLAKHLRGNDLVMIEADWRLNELAKAGLRENWSNAEYQLDKMFHAMELGAERRPKRAASYKWFFSTAYAPLDEAIKNQNRQQFVERFPVLVQHCNECHELEKVTHFVAEIPRVFSEASPSAPPK